MGKPTGVLTDERNEQQHCSWHAGTALAGGPELCTPPSPCQGVPSVSTDPSCSHAACSQILFPKQNNYQCFRLLCFAWLHHPCLLFIVVLCPSPRRLQMGHASGELWDEEKDPGMPAPALPAHQTPRLRLPCDLGKIQPKFCFDRELHFDRF